MARQKEGRTRAQQEAGFHIGTSLRNNGLDSGRNQHHTGDQNQMRLPVNGSQLFSMSS